MLSNVFKNGSSRKYIFKDGKFSINPTVAYSGNSINSDGTYNVKGTFSIPFTDTSKEVFIRFKIIADNNVVVPFEGSTVFSEGDKKGVHIYAWSSVSMRNTYMTISSRGNKNIGIILQNSGTSTVIVHSIWYENVGGGVIRQLITYLANIGKEVLA